VFQEDAMLTLQRPPRTRKRPKPARPASVAGREILRISQGGCAVGDVLLDGLERVLRRDAAIPRDVVLKALVLYTRRHVLIGEVVSREDGRTYAWDVLDEDEC
jgi:hypothetical protein